MAAFGFHEPRAAVVFDGALHFHDPVRSSVA
jgi:hypothetical protein